ncbi:GTP-binding protein [Flavobacteriaceae bacterium]|nr:GTP-binding protein [Flavobacteriaceae bacterium]
MNKKIIKFLTAGNVDDGKSTLIGRLLYDTESLYQDQIDEVLKSTDKSFTKGNLDFSLFLDGLSSERAQKITIDVAYRYFAYKNQKFIIADAPGHEQYTRNMAVAAANSDIVIILIDAKKGVKTQTIRHSYIANLFGIKNIIVAVNKMDLINYDHNIFNDIRHEYLAKTKHLDFNEINFVPISAVSGDNIVKNHQQMPWYDGKSIIEYLLETKINYVCTGGAKLQIQNIFKDNDKRYYQGLVSAGKLAIGDKIISYPAKKEAKIVKIVHSGNEVNNAKKDNSISVMLDNEIDLDRGGLISDLNNKPYFDNKFQAKIIWFSDDNFAQIDRKEYLLKINHQYIRACIENVNHIVNINDTASKGNEKTYSQGISLNQIADVDIVMTNNVAFDFFKNNENLGSFLLIDKNDNSTVCCGIITDEVKIKKQNSDKKEEFLQELSILVKKYFGKEMDFSI